MATDCPDKFTSDKFAQDKSVSGPSVERIKARLTNKALHYLGSYASTSARLEQVLQKFARRKLEQAEPALVNIAIADVIKTCVRLGYIDEGAFIRGQFRQGLQAGYSQQRILLKLAQKGISRKTAMAVMARQADASMQTDKADLVAALIYARKKSVGPYARAALGPEDRQKHLARLARNGFGFDRAKQVMDLPSSDAADALLAKIYPHQMG